MSIYVTDRGTEAGFISAFRGGRATADQIRIARAISDVTGEHVSVSIAVAKKLEEHEFVTAHMIRSQYPMGGLTYDLVESYVKASK